MTQQNCKCRSCRESDKTINHILSECVNLEKYKSRYDCLGNMIHWELCEKFEFDHTNKWYTHNSEFVLENKTHKIFWDFNIQANYQILA